MPGSVAGFEFAERKRTVWPRLLQVNSDSVRNGTPFRRIKCSRTQCSRVYDCRRHHGNRGRHGGTMAVLDAGATLASLRRGGKFGGAFRGAHWAGSGARDGTRDACDDGGFACTGRAMRSSARTWMSTDDASWLPPNGMGFGRNFRAGDGRGNAGRRLARTDRDCGVRDRVEPPGMGVDVVVRAADVKSAGNRGIQRGCSRHFRTHPRTDVEPGKCSTGCRKCAMREPADPGVGRGCDPWSANQDRQPEPIAASAGIPKSAFVGRAPRSGISPTSRSGQWACAYPRKSSGSKAVEGCGATVADGWQRRNSPLCSEAGKYSPAFPAPDRRKGRSDRGEHAQGEAKPLDPCVRTAWHLCPGVRTARVSVPATSSDASSSGRVGRVSSS